MVELALHHPHQKGPFFILGVSAVTAWCFPGFAQPEAPLRSQSQHLDFLTDTTALWGWPVSYFVSDDTNIWRRSHHVENHSMVYAGLCCPEELQPGPREGRAASRLSAQSLGRALVSSSTCPSPHLPTPAAGLFTHPQTWARFGEQQVCPVPLSISIRMAAPWEIWSAGLESTTHSLFQPWLKHFCSLQVPVGRAAVPGVLPPTSQPSRRAWNITKVLTSGAPGSLQKANTWKKHNIFLASMHSSTRDGTLGCPA